MARKKCLRCGKRFGSEAERCITCGSEIVAVRGRAGRTTSAVTALLAIIALVGSVSLSDRYLPALSDWYYRMVISYLPEAALPFTVPDNDQAFYVCARSVVRQLDNETSVVTFARLVDARTTELGNGRYSIESYVDEAVAKGVTYRRTFACTLKQNGESWMLEAVELGEATPGTVTASAQ
jgi:hypothetical protein